MGEPQHLSQQEISQKYDHIAGWYDCFEAILELFGLNRLRKRMVQRASGTVLEIAIGTGKNLPHYPPGCRIIGADASKEMLAIARRRASPLQLNTSFLLADAEVLPFPDGIFDTVVSSLSTCTFPDPVGALKEMARVCRPTGKVLLLEHGRSDREWLGRWQDRHADQFVKPLGCHWNREPLQLTQDAGLKIVRAQRDFFGIFHQIEAVPGWG
jgi:ubiquinone/menaquinone biosynthesis C-methylase UbiE